MQPKTQHLTIYKNLILDFVAFALAPFLLYSFLSTEWIIDSDIFKALSLSLATCLIAYIAVFCFIRGYSKLDFNSRFYIYAPPFLLVSAYWVVLTESGSVYPGDSLLAFLFGLILAGALAFVRVLRANKT